MENPTVQEAVKFVENTLSERKALIIVGNCWVEYRGRASSKLEPGERIVMIKEDGSVLVHRPAGYEPVNWQPPGCLFQTRVTKDVLEVRAVRRKPSESVKVFFDRVYLLSALNLIDRGKFSLYASEEDMQKAILLEPEILEQGFKPITYEKKVEPGFVDIYGTDKDGKFVVVEIKRKTAGKEAALQLAKYVDSVKASVSREVRGVLVAPRLAKGVQRLLVTLGLGFRALNPRKCAEVLSRPETRRLEEFFGEGK
jgi:RecB family endonuclease NucS